MSSLDEALKNGTAIGGTPKAYEPAPQLVEFVKGLMHGVQTGRITSLLAVSVGPMGEVQWPAWGGQAHELMIGAEMFRDDAKAMMRKQGAQSKIIRAG